MKKNKKKYLCIIPARGGSKRVPNKNIIDFGGFPLIYYSINAAKKSGVFDDIIVSTDSKKIQKIAQKYGAEVPFLRPKKLSKNESLVEDAVFYLLKYLEKEGRVYDYICLSQCSTPLVISEDFQNACSILNKKKANMVISVTKTPFNINWTSTLGKDLSMENFSNCYATFSQQFEQTYILNGAIYFGENEIFYNKENYYSKKSFAYIMPNERSIDIDTHEDIKKAEYFLKLRKN